MAELPEESKGKAMPRQAPEHGGSDPRATQRGARAPDDATDPREEEGWTQPESSAQKGAEPND
jgi:hypothetical protein